MVGALLVFMGLNSERIVEQNSQYLEVSTSQTARRLNDMFDASLESTRAMASVFEDSLEGPDVNPAEAVDVLTQSQFDQTFFVTTDGVAYNYDGRTADAADRHYYIEGMKGQSGVWGVHDALFQSRNVAAFYAPVRFHGEVVGVMVCGYLDETLTELMTTDLFGHPTPTYLVDPMGDVVAIGSSVARSRRIE